MVSTNRSAYKKMGAMIRSLKFLSCEVEIHFFKSSGLLMSLYVFLALSLSLINEKAVARFLEFYLTS